MRKMLACSALMFSFAAAAGCDIDVDKGHDECDLGHFGDECDGNDECGDDLECDALGLCARSAVHVTGSSSSGSSSTGQGSASTGGGGQSGSSSAQGGAPPEPGCLAPGDCDSGQTCDVGSCVPAPCDQLDSEALCSARADCEPVYAGVDCSCGIGCSCTGGEPGCVCQSFEFFVCQSQGAS